jgi:hypothetical protein
MRDRYLSEKIGLSVRITEALEANGVLRLADLAGLD